MRLTECDEKRAVALVATIGSGERQAIVGLGECATRGTAADVAFVVASDFRNRGIAGNLCLPPPER
jgi:hypothetical protein